MKKILNNSGLTLVEVIAASIILAIIIVPILNMLLQAIKMNANSDIEMKMKAEAERVIEEVKAANGDTNIGGTDYSVGVYYDRLFKSVSSSDPNKYYKLTADETMINTIDTSSQYDRWDFKAKLNSSGTQIIQVFKNTGSLDSSYSGAGGKLYTSSELTLGYPNTATKAAFDFVGEASGYKLNYTIDGANGPNTGQVFTPGIGKVDAGDNTIVMDIDRSTGVSTFDISVTNSTYYNSDGSFYTKTVDGNPTLAYHKNIIVNVFNDDPNSPAVNVTPQSPYITVNHIPSAMSVITNGNKINVKIYKVSDLTTPVKVITSLVK